MHLNIPFYPPPQKKEGLTAIYLLILVHLFCHSVGKPQSSSFFQGLYLTNYKCKGLACTVALSQAHLKQYKQSLDHITAGGYLGCPSLIFPFVKP